MTTTDALHQYAPDVLAIVELSDELKAQLQAAMQEYAEEKARHFAGWICDQRIQGRTYYKLWLDYLQEHPMQ